MQRIITVLLTGICREARALRELIPLGVAAILLTGLAMNSSGALALFQSQVSPVDTPTATPTIAAPTATSPAVEPTATPPPAGPTPTPGPVEATPTPEMTPSPIVEPPTATPLPATPAPTRPPRPTATPTPRPPLGGLGPNIYLRVAVIAFVGAAIMLLMFGLVRKWKPRAEQVPPTTPTAGERETDVTD
jgi:hypothetical protein